MTDDVNALSDLEITAYHEAGHTVVARVLGKPIRSIILFFRKHVGTWNGISNNEPFSTIDPKWTSLDLDRDIPYDELPPQNPDNEYKNDRDQCIVTCVGWVTEELLYKQLGRNESMAQADENAEDIRKARGQVQRFPLDEQEKELLNAETHAREILSHPSCWCMVDNLAVKMVDAIQLGKKPLRSNDLWEIYIFSQDDVYESFERTLTKKANIEILGKTEQRYKRCT